MRVIFVLVTVIVACACGGCVPARMSVAAAVDPVCGVEVEAAAANGAWLTSQWKDKTYCFCSEACKSQFDTAPMMYHAKCPVCDFTLQKTAALALEHGGKTYYFDSKDHRASFAREPARFTGGLATDIVCGMEVSRTVAGETGLIMQYGGTTFYFCGVGCKERFASSPERYLGDRTAVDPVCGMTVVKADAETAGLVSLHNGETYYFCASSCKRYFERNPERYVKP